MAIHGPLAGGSSNCQTLCQQTAHQQYNQSIDAGYSALCNTMINQGNGTNKSATRNTCMHNSRHNKHVVMQAKHEEACFPSCLICTKQQSTPPHLSTLLVLAVVWPLHTVHHKHSAACTQCIMHTVHHALSAARCYKMHTSLA